MPSSRIQALRELASEAELERRDFVYEATEQLRRFFDGLFHALSAAARRQNQREQQRNQDKNGKRLTL